jgi:hypothetical protein
MALQPIDCTVDCGELLDLELTQPAAVDVGNLAFLGAILSMLRASTWDVPQVSGEWGAFTVAVTRNELLFTVARPGRREHDSPVRATAPSACPIPIWRKIDLLGTLPGVSDLAVGRLLKDEDEARKLLGIAGGRVTSGATGGKERTKACGDDPS